MQHLIDGMSRKWQEERSESQMTLGKLIDELFVMDPMKEVHGIQNPHSYRGYYSDLAFETNIGVMTTAVKVLEIARSCMGEVFTGYKGGDFQMGRNTPIWSANYGCCGMKIMGFDEDGNLILAEDD